MEINRLESCLEGEKEETKRLRERNKLLERKLAKYKRKLAQSNQTHTIIERQTRQEVSEIEYRRYSSQGREKIKMKSKSLSTFYSDQNETYTVEEKIDELEITKITY